MVELDNMLYDNTTITWQLNDKEKELMMTSRHMIWKKECDITYDVSLCYQ